MAMNLKLVLCLLIFGSNIAVAQIGVTTKHAAFIDATIRKPLFYKKEKMQKKEVNISAIPRAYCYQDLAFFCKIEVKLEKHLTLPVKFRLGSVPYTDYLEQK